MATDTMTQATATQTATATETETAVLESTASEVTTMDKATLEQAVKEPVKDTPETQPKAQLKATETPVLQEPSEVEKLKVEMDKLKKQVADKDTYIRQRESIIGQQNRQITDFKQQAERLRTQAQDKFFENPAESTRMIYQAEQAEAEAKTIENRQMYESNRQAITQYAPDYQDLVGDIAELISERGYPPHLVEQFKANPWNEPASIAVPFAEAARARKMARDLETKIKTLDKKPEEIAKNIANAAKQTPGITGSTGGSSTDTSTTITQSDIRKMSRAQLKEYLAKTK